MLLSLNSFEAIRADEGPQKWPLYHESKWLEIIADFFTVIQAHSALTWDENSTIDWKIICQIPN